MILYLSDNGPNGARWNGDMKGRKGSTDEGGVRSPLLIQWPGVIAEGVQVQPIAAAIDLLPTLAEMASVELTPELILDGISLASHLTDGSEAIPDRYIFSYWRGRTSVRSQRYRLSHDSTLFDMVQDPGQTTDITDSRSAIAQEMIAARQKWQNDVLPDSFESKPFTVGHSDLQTTHLPARDAYASGGIVRSNRYPNDGHFANWVDTTGRIMWDVTVLSSGTYLPTVYYTGPVSSVGTVMELSLGDAAAVGHIPMAHDPPLIGMNQDRVPRIESYVKAFQPMQLAPLSLESGDGRLTLRALTMAGPTIMDFRLLTLQKLD